MTADLVLDRFLPYRLSVAANAVSTRVSTAYRRRFGLKIPEWRLVAILAEHPHMTPVQLAQATRMDKIAVSRAAVALIDRGLVDAADNPGDGRSHFLALTPAGHALHAEIAPLALAIEAAMFADVTPAERALLDDLLRRIEASAGESAANP